MKPDLVFVRGRGLVGADAEKKPVAAKAAPVTEIVTPVTAVTKKDVTRVTPGEVCPTCGHVARVRSAAAVKQAAYRARKKVPT